MHEIASSELDAENHSQRTKRWSIRITPEGWLYLLVAFVALIGAYSQQVNVLILCFAVMFGLFLIHPWIALQNIHHLEIRRVFPSEITAGRSAEVGIEIRQPVRWSGTHAVHVEDSARSAQGTSRWRFSFPYLRGPKFTRATQAVIFQYRGSVRYPRFVLETRFPFGLMVVRKTITAPDEVVVFPRIGKLAPHASHLIAGLDSATSSSRLGVGAQEEILSLRAYHHGDDLRHIHWRTTAKTGELMVKEFTALSGERTAVVFLTDPGGASRDDFERTVRLVATICERLCRRQDGRLLLAIPGESSVVLEGPASHRLFEQILRQLALVEPTGVVEQEAVCEIAVTLPASMSVWLIGAAGVGPIATQFASLRPGGRRATSFHVVGETPYDWERWYIDDPPPVQSGEKSA